MWEDKNGGWETGGRGNTVGPSVNRRVPSPSHHPTTAVCLCSAGDRKQQQRCNASTLKTHILNIHLKNKWRTDGRCSKLDPDPPGLSSSTHVLQEAGLAGWFETTAQQPRAESCRPADDGWTLQLRFQFVSLLLQTFPPLLGFFHIPTKVLIFSSLHILLFYLLSSLGFRVHVRV